MSFFWPIASRFPCKNTRQFQICRATELFSKAIAPRLRLYSYSCTPFRRKCITPWSIQNGLHAAAPSISRSAAGSVGNVRRHSSQKLIRNFGELPKSYMVEQGLPFRSIPLSKKEIVQIFGENVNEATANRVLRVLHGRRVAGTLDDPSISPTSAKDERLRPLALQWLRQNVPVDEEENAAQKAIQELQSMDEEEMFRGVKIGIYKPNFQRATDTTGQREGDIYGPSVLDALRIAKEKLLDEQEKAKKQQEKEAAQKSGTLATQEIGSRVELRTPVEVHWIQEYLEKAERTTPDSPPDMSVLQRLWPSGLLTVAIVGGAMVFATYYTMPKRDARLFPDVPPAASTILGLIAANGLIFLLWRFRPAFGVLRRYFLVLPGYPRALAIVGSTFSHQTVRHFLINMFVLWFMGLRLHEDIGRANFLAIYFASGALSAFASQSIFTLRNVLISSSLGASGAIAGVTGAYLWLHANEYFKFFGLPPEPMRGVPGLTILGCIVGLEIIAMMRTWRTGMKFDHYAHLAGYATGVLSAEILQRRNREQARLLQGKIREMGYSGAFPELR